LFVRNKIIFSLTILPDGSLPRQKRWEKGRLAAREKGIPLEWWKETGDLRISAMREKSQLLVVEGMSCIGLPGGKNKECGAQD
jgi:hypothetical protein